MMSSYLLIIIFISSVFVTFSQTYIPEGYIGCYQDWWRRILQGKRQSSSTNSGDECIQVCKIDGYRYAGTESEDECFCGHKLRVQKKRYDCNHRCMGNYNEICGGDWRISVYDIWLINEDTTSTFYTSTTTELETTTRKVVTRKSTTQKLTSVSFKSTYVTTSERSSNESFSNNTFKTTEYPNSETKGDSSISMITVYAAVPIGIAFLILIILLGVFTRRRRQDKKKIRLEKLSHGTDSIPNIYANIISPNHEPSENVIKAKSSKDVLPDDTYSDTYVTNVNEDKREHGSKEMEETDEYNTLTKQTTTVDTTDNPYHHLTNSMNDEAYSICSGNQFPNDKIYSNNTYSHIKDTVKQTSSISNSDIGDNVYNTLQLRKNRHPERTKNVKEVSHYGSTTFARSMSMDNGDDYSHTNEVALKNFDWINKSFGDDDNIYYNDNNYVSVETEFKN